MHIIKKWPNGLILLSFILVNSIAYAVPIDSTDMGPISVDAGAPVNGYVLSSGETFVFDNAYFISTVGRGGTCKAPFYPHITITPKTTQSRGGCVPKNFVISYSRLADSAAGYIWLANMDHNFESCGATGLMISWVVHCLPFS